MPAHGPVITRSDLRLWRPPQCWRDKIIDDVGFVREVIKKLSGPLNIDTKRISPAVMSNDALFW